MVTDAATRPAPPIRSAPRRADEWVLQSKITPPPLLRWALSRPRIDRRLAAAARRPVTLLTGPPGAGKTMALASWAAAEPGPIAWVTLDEHDNRPLVFWSYVIAALRHSGVAVPATVWAPERDTAFYDGLSMRLAAAIVACGAPVFLVLDDLHLVTDHRSIDALALLLRNARPGLHLVVGSRSDPLLPLHRYRLAGEMTEIRADELAFRRSEAESIFAHHGLSLSVESLGALMERTQGWAAVLRLAAISMQDHHDPELFVKELVAEDGAVAGYLVDEVLNGQPADTRDVLLRTSILDQVNAEIAVELAGDPAARTAFEALAHADGIVAPVGHGWYRYHPLLGEVMRLKLQHESPGLVSDLHRRAARWLRRDGALVEAVRHAAAIEDWRLAAQIIVDEFGVSQVLAPGEENPLADALRDMPQDTAWAQSRPWLLHAALSLARGADAAAADALAAAERTLGEQVAPGSEIPARVTAEIIRLALHSRAGEFHAAAAAAAQAESLLGSVPEDLMTGHPELPADVLASRGIAQFWAGLFDQAAATLGAGTAAADNRGARARCQGYLALLDALRGQLGSAAELATHAIGGPSGASGGLAGCAATVALALVHVERSELAGARIALRQANDGLHVHPDRLIGAVACLAAARVFVAERRTTQALEMIQRARRGAALPAWLECRLARAESQAQAATGVGGPATPAARPAGAGTGPGAADAHRRLDTRAGADGAARTVTGGERGPRVTRPPARALPGQVIVAEDLTERERAVLLCVSQMFNTAEVAEEMCVSVNTVKSHLKSIFRKLAVTSRSEAVRRARRLELI
jgi:LuxR family transcriptional regulator, maltose regulon positive regulatory protein